MFIGEKEICFGPLEQEDIEQHVYSTVNKEKKKSSRLGQEKCLPGQQIEGVYALATWKEGRQFQCLEQIECVELCICACIAVL